MLVNVNGERLFFDVVGPQLQPEGDQMVERPALIVLHGGPGYDHSTLRPYFDRFADICTVIYVDHRGCGRSSGDVATWTLDQWADDLAAFCETLGIAKPVVFGQSFGGMVAMHYAARHRDGPSKVILSSTAAKFLMDETVAVMDALGGPDAAALARRFFTEPSLDRFAEYSEVCVPLYTNADSPDAGAFRNRAIQRPEVAVHFFQDEMKTMDMRAEIAGIDCPTLVLAGAIDPVTPVACARDIAEAIGANAQLEVFEGCGHGVHRDDPDRAEQVLRAFLTAV